MLYYFYHSLSVLKKVINANTLLNDNFFARVGLPITFKMEKFGCFKRNAG